MGSFIPQFKSAESIKYVFERVKLGYNVLDFVMEYASRNWLKLPQLQSAWLQDKQNLESKTLCDKLNYTFWLVLTDA